MNERPKFVMMVGVSGAGKSTFAKNYCSENNFSYVASDEVRRKMFGDDENPHVPSKNALVFDACHKTIIELLKDGNNVVFDATNLISKRRIQALEKIKKAVPNVHCVVMILIAPINICFAQNENRDYVVEKSVIEKQIGTFQLPFAGEGWNKIILIPANGFYFSEICSRKLESIMIKYDFNQRNPNHTLSLYDHCKKTRNNIYKAVCNSGVWNFNSTFSNAHLYEAAMLHDCGKLGCHTEDADGVWHYYNHAERGAYEYLTTQLVSQDSQNFYKAPRYQFLRSFDEIYKVALLINYHMLPFEWGKNKKMKQKYKRLFGDDIFEALELLHKCDIEAK